MKKPVLADDRVFKIQPELEKQLAKLIKEKFAVDILSEKFPGSADSRRIATSVMKLSDFFISAKTEATPWLEPWCQLAYLSYYMVLNEIRCRAVLQEAQKNHFLQNIEQVIDFGSGLGAATYSLAKLLPLSTQYIHIERAATAQNLHKSLSPAGGSPARWTDLPTVPAKNSLGVFSFSLNELETWPDWMQQFEQLMIIEPATSQQGRVLLQNRKKLMGQGFSAWAPCTHQGDCPLLEKSKNDWCHDRVFFDQPTWFQAIEDLMPIKNQTLTFSYLLMSKKPAPAKPGLARITGDLLDEKGKSRQLVCRNSDREYLTWMLKNSTPQRIPRGAVIQWPEHFEVKSNEIRVSELIVSLDKPGSAGENSST